MNAASFVIIRRPKPDNIRDKVRFMSLGFGWSTNPDLARAFDSRLDAKIALQNRPGEIVRAADILEVEP